MKSTLEILKDSPTLGALDVAHLEFLAECARTKTFDSGEIIFRQGEPATACFVLVTGKVRMSFTPRRRHGEDGRKPSSALPLREYDDPGRLLGWSGLLAPFHYRTTVTALAPTEVFVLDRDVLDRYAESHPGFGVALLERIIWVLGNRLRETRIRLVSRRYSKEATAIRALLDQSAEQLHVDSPLHKIPFYLENRLTIADAFQALELVKAHGDAGESDIAGQMLEILQQVRKELRLYQDLQHVYEAVASAPASTPTEVIRKRCCEEFVKLFGRLDYVIRGEENLPERRGHIFVMNHLFNNPDNTLPNHFQLTLDTHFVSSMLLMKRYGDAPIRVIRESKPDEFGHQQYYDRLGYIYVHAGRVDEPNISREEQQRFFLDSARDCLLAGKNLVICPEGTSVATDESPVAFKAGAFRLAAYVDPEPLIVPIAVANFDKSITRTSVAAVVHKPFRLSDFVPRPVDDRALFDFINRFQATFRGYVREAVVLCGSAPPTKRSSA